MREAGAFALHVCRMKCVQFSIAAEKMMWIKCRQCPIYQWSVTSALNELRGKRLWYHITLFRPTQCTIIACRHSRIAHI